MSANAAVAAINVAIITMITVCTVVVAVWLNSAAGLWSLFGLLFLCSTSTSEDKD